MKPKAYVILEKNEGVWSLPIRVFLNEDEAREYCSRMNAKGHYYHAIPVDMGTYE